MTEKTENENRISEIQARCAAARPGPWQAFIEGRDFMGGSSMIRIGEGKEEDLHLTGYDVAVPDADFDFIANARQDIPFLLDEIEQLSGHRILKQIDRNRPYFTREITRLLGGKSTKHLLEIWLPVESENDGWLAAVTIDGLNLPNMSAMPGDDPLDAMISAVRFIRGLFDDNEGEFVFSVWKHGKLPKNMDHELAEYQFVS
jgi:hypothetical protein